jgi:hypothetical protein
MNFDGFRKDIETKIKSIAEFELQEYHYQPYSFGSGVLVYRIQGQHHKFVFDGRDSELTWYVSKPHQKYFEADFKEILRKDILELSTDELKNEIKNNVQHTSTKP